MNTIQIIAMCKNIHADYIGMGRMELREDAIILDTIIRVYNTTEIDWEEVKWLWTMYLENGSLYFSDAMKMARERIAYEDMMDKRATEESLIAWLHEGI